MKHLSRFFRYTGAIILLNIMAVSSLMAQQQQGFSYQAVARNLSGSPIIDQALTVRIGIHSESLDGELIWGEEHDVMTNPLGLFTLKVGDPGAKNKSGSAASFDQIDWSALTYYLKVWVKKDGEFLDMGGSPIQTVPIAQYATSAKNSAGTFSVQSSDETKPGEALFEVKRSDGQPVFAVYEDMVWVYSDPSGTKGIKGGFAVGGYNRTTKGVTEEYMRVTSDSVRVYIDSNPDSKGIKGGFAVGGYNRTNKAPSNDIYTYISGKSSVDVVEEASQIMWYPRKEAFLAGNIHIGHVDSVGQNSTALGYKSIAMGNYSQAFGYRSMSIGKHSTSFGYKSIAEGEDSYALGSGSLASAKNSFAIGVNATASALSSMALGTNSDATNSYATSLGYRSHASGPYSTAIGLGSEAIGERSMALGMWSESSGYRSLSLGYYSISGGPYSVAIGPNALAPGDTAISIGSNAEAVGANSVAIGTGSSATQQQATAIGNGAVASQRLATAIGYNAIADGYKSISMGAYYSKSLVFIPPIIIIPPIIFPKGGESDIETPKEPESPKGTFVVLPLFANRGNQAIGTYSLAIGNGNRAENSGIAIGVYNDAMDTYSTAVGFGNQAIAPYSFAGGFANKTEGEFATAFGRYTSAASYNSFVIGRYNKSNGTSDDWIATDPLFQVGNGTGPGTSDQHDAFRINKNGGAYMYPTNAYYGLYLYNNNDATYPSTYGYGVRALIARNKAGVTYYSGYFSDTGSEGVYRGLYADVRWGDGFDVAEYYHDSRDDTEPGDVVVADPNVSESVIKSAGPYQTSVLGVISTAPHMVMGADLLIDSETGKEDPNISGTILALSGRVPVKMTEENGPIEPGDLLTTSSVVGHAMKWSLMDVNEAKDFAELKSMLAENERRRNAIIGKAVSSSSAGTGTVMVLISLQ